MSAKITFTVNKGKAQQSVYEYSQKESLIAGRDETCCHILFDQSTVSRCHCLIELAPPYVRVRDFGSLNGTYLNGKIIGQRDPKMSIEEGRKMLFNEFDIKSGDRLGLGKDCEITIKIVQDNINKASECMICKKKMRAADNVNICSDCKNDFSLILSCLMDEAQKGTGDASVIAGYRTISVLGKGGMGEVWLVEEEKTGKQMALKVMLPKVSVDEGSRMMFLREAGIGEQLVHENIVRHYKVGKTEGDIYFILMEFCPGGSLDQLMYEMDGVFNIDSATDIILQVLKGLDYAHKANIKVGFSDGSVQTVNGIVHRDLKPGNIFVAGTPQRPIAKVADFGLAKAFEISGQYGLTRTGAKAGTPYFMPKQQAKDFKYSKTDVDVWAAAATYYYMLTGCPPKEFDGRDVFLDVLQNSAVPIRKRNSHIPAKLAEVIDYALREEPDIGVKTAAQLYNMIVDAVR